MFDAWDEQLKHDVWQKAFAECGLTQDFYARRVRPFDELLPWSHIDVGVSPDFLKAEYEKAVAAETTVNCAEGVCNTCGLESWGVGCP
jgi:hypothetical protein